MKVKICGLSLPSDIAAVNQYRPGYAGFIINFPKSHRSCTPEQVQALHAQLSPDIPAVGVTVNQPLGTVASLLEHGIIDIAQLHGQEDDAYIQALQARTGKPIWKAFRIRSTDDLDAARASSADMILLDNGYGTGETFDWTLVRDIGRRLFWQAACARKIYRMLLLCSRMQWIFPAARRQIVSRIPKKSAP